VYVSTGLQVPAERKTTVEVSKYASMEDVKKAIVASLGLANIPKYRLWIKEATTSYSTVNSTSKLTADGKRSEPTKLTREITDRLTGGWVFLREETIYTHDYPSGVIELMVELREGNLEAIDSAPVASLSDNDKKKSIADIDEDEVLELRDGLLNVWQTRLMIGDVVDAVDKQGKWYESVLVEGVTEGHLRVHFKGWSSKWDDDIPLLDAPIRIQPLNSRTANWRGRLRVSIVVLFTY
jgi:hypothetical protein